MKPKSKISTQIHRDQSLPTLLEQLRGKDEGYRIPEGYFNSLGPRIVDNINSQEQKSFFKILFPAVRKPWVWAPAMSIVVISVLLVFLLPDKKAPPVQVTDEWTELNMAYDPSYAEEVFLAESNTIDKALESKEIKFYDPTSLTSKDEPSEAEINEYLKEHMIETDVLNPY